LIKFNVFHHKFALLIEVVFAETRWDETQCGVESGHHSQGSFVPLGRDKRGLENVKVIVVPVWAAITYIDQTGER